MALAQRNVNLVIADIDAAATKETAVACRQSGVVVHCLQTDLASAEGPSDMINQTLSCLLYTSPSPRDRSLSRMPSSA